MFGLKLKKKKKKAEKGLILANKGAQGEAFRGWGGTTTLGPTGLTDLMAPCMRMGFTLCGTKVRNGVHSGASDPASPWCGPRPPPHFQCHWSSGHWTKRGGWIPAGLWKGVPKEAVMGSELLPLL